jgi:hypothetical protein
MEVSMKKICALSLAFILLIASGCSDKKETPTGGDNNTPVHYIVPLKNLNSWFGFRNEYNSSGTFVGAVQYVIEVEKDTAVDNATWYIVPISVGNPPQVNYMNLFQNGATGDVRLIYDYKTTPSPSRVWLKFPAAVNDTYATGSDLDDTATVTNTDTSITVTLGTYSCYRYEILRHDGNDIYKDYYYLLPDTGFIRWETYYTPDGGTEYMQYQWDLLTATLY